MVQIPGKTVDLPGILRRQEIRMLQTKHLFGSSRFTRPLLLVFLLSATLALAQSTRPGMGSIPYADTAGTGVTFRVWAPNATTVAVAGDFNGWSGTQDPLVSESGGNWSLDLAGASNGQEYKYVIDGTLWKRDPRSRKVTNSDGNSVVYDTDAFAWDGDDFSPPWVNDLVIYEMHAGTFYAPFGTPGKFSDCVQKLDHLRQLGVSAVEVMPISEFAGDHSWGYNPADLFSIENFAYGGPDGFKAFVKACHERGIAVLVDIVHNHYGPSDLALWQFDGWNQNGHGGIYFYNEDGKCCTVWGETRPDFGRQEVRDFIKDQVLMYLEEYRVDGFRWDTPFHMTHYGDFSTYIPEAAALLQEINSMMATGFPGRIRIAEDEAFGNGFDSEWDTGYHDNLHWQVIQSSDASRNMSDLAGHINNGAGHGRVIYTESHDEVGDLNNKERLPRDIDSSDPTSIWARKRSLLAAAVMMTSPGVPMLFQGQEMLEDWQFSNFTALRWDRTNTYSGVVRAYQDLVRLRRNLAGGTQGLKGTGCDVYRADDGNKVIAYHRWDAGGVGDDVVVLANFAATAWQGGTYQVEFPSAGTWYAHFNSDSTRYGSDFSDIGQASVVASGSPATAAVDMGLYSLQIFSKAEPVPAGLVETDPAAPEGCVDVVITYDPNGGPLDGASPVYIHLGRNAWSETNSPDAAMSAVGDGRWQYTYAVPFDTYEINCVFNDGGGVWDRNHTLDWHIPVADCTNGAAAEVTFIPAHPVGCDDITITYEPRGGPLQAADPVFIHLGRNGWNDIITPDPAMTQVAAGVWSYTYALSNETRRVNCAFHDGGDIWDSLGGQNWNVTVLDCSTNPMSDLSFAYGKPSVSEDPVSGQNNVGDRFDLNQEGGYAATVDQGGFGQFGKLYINYDETNFYIGATGCEMSGDNTAMIIFLDFNTMSVNANNLWGLTGQPAGLDVLHNVWFETPMDVAILLGDEFGDNTFWSFQLGSGADVGQGVFRLVSQFPGFAQVTGARISQFDGLGVDATASEDDDLNRSMNRWEVCMPWSGLFANGYESISSCTVAGLFVNDVVSGNDRYLSSNYLGQDANADGFDSTGNFGLTNFVHLWGLPVSLTPADDDGDGLPNGWELLYFGDPTNAVPSDDSDTNGFSNLEEFLADTDPLTASSQPLDVGVDMTDGLEMVVAPSSASRVYDVFCTTNLPGQEWQPAATGVSGNNGELRIHLPADTSWKLFRTSVRHP